MNPEYLSITFKVSGHINLRERVELAKEENDDPYPAPIDLIDTPIKSINLSVRLDEDGDRSISLSVHHAASASGKAYHASLDAYLPCETITQLRNFFDLLVKFEECDDN